MDLYFCTFTSNVRLYRYSEDKYTTCPTEKDGDDCNLSINSIVFYPIIAYLLWQVMYIVWVSQYS